MAVYKWRPKSTPNFGEVWVPYAEVRLIPTGTTATPRQFLLQIDSGATVSLLRRSAADLLGLNLQAGRRIELTGVGGSGITAWEHRLLTLFSDSERGFQVRYAIAETEDVPNLLGRLDVFDRFQVDFDSSLSETRVSGRWLTNDEARMWRNFLDLAEHVESRFDGRRWPDEQVREAAGRFLQRGQQLVAAAAGLARSHCEYEGPLLVRAAFEIAAQFEYLMRDPVPRAVQYLEFSAVTRWKHIQANVADPGGPITRRLAESPRRAEAEPRLRAEYERVEAGYRKKPDKERHWPNWYCMSIADLAREVGWDPEYRLWYAESSAWAHGDPWVSGNDSFAEKWQVILNCVRYYGRMLLRLTESQQIVLAAEQYKILELLSKPFH